MGQLDIQEMNALGISLLFDAEGKFHGGGRMRLHDAREKEQPAEQNQNDRGPGGKRNGEATPILTVRTLSRFHGASC
jgi:hypothetical protein